MPSEERNMSWKIRPTWNGAAMHFSSLWQLSVQSEDKSSVLGNTSQKKNWFLSGIAQITSPRIASLKMEKHVLKIHD